MAILIFSDGKRREVPYDTAAKVYQVLTGKEEPKDPEQAEFVLTVAEVVFDGSPVRVQVTLPTLQREHDIEMDKILANDKLKGRDKAKAVIERIKERRYAAR